jgi:predicted ATPase
VTIAGMGGSGKTRLGLEVARAFATPSSAPAEQPFPDGIIFVPMPDVATSSRAEAAQLIAGACEAALELGSPGTVGDGRQRLAEYLGSRALLLVLDNFESLQPGAADIQQLLKEAPHVKVLVTSRAPLHIAGERVLHVDGLHLPQSPLELELAEASALFLQEARRVQVGYALPEEQRAHLVEVCRLVGGFPLALVLAARWAPVLPCSEMVRELTDSLDVLATAEPDLPERHRSVQAMLDTTLARLSPEERELAQCLAETPVELEAYLAYANQPLPDMLPSLRGLSDQALVSVDAVCGTPRLHPLLSRHVRGRGRLARRVARVTQLVD